MIQVLKNIDQLKKAIKLWFGKKYKKENFSEKRILLKPNIGYPKPAPYTTSMEVIKATVEVITEQVPKEIIIGEGSTSKSSALNNFKIIGLMDKLRDYQISYIDFNDYDFERIVIKNGTYHYLPKILKEVDIRISLPIIKFYFDDNNEIFLSNALKNYFGLPPKEKYKEAKDSFKRDSLHSDIHQSVVEIYQAVQKYVPFDLIICDGIDILLGEGSLGEPYHWGKIILAEGEIEADLKVLELLKKPLPRYLRMLTKV